MHYFALSNMLHCVSSPFIKTLILLLSLYIIEIICITNHGLEIIPERSDVTYQNEKYVKNLKSYVRRFGRRGPYVSHLGGDLQQAFGNNVTISMILYEYLHNEYRRSFVEFHIKLCDFINMDKYLGNLIRNRGITCPVPKGYWNISNTRMVFPVFPYVFPFNRAKTEIICKHTATGEIIATGNTYIFIKQR